MPASPARAENTTLLLFTCWEAGRASEEASLWPPTSQGTAWTQVGAQPWRTGERARLVWAALGVTDIRAGGGGRPHRGPEPHPIEAPREERTGRRGVVITPGLQERPGETST